MTRWDLPKTYSFKHDNDPMLLTMISPILLSILAEMNVWAIVEGLEFKYTRTIDKKIKNISTSDIHASGRAADLSSKNWSKEKIEEFCEYFNSRYAADYGTSMTGKNPRVAYYEKNGGTAPHFHMQIRRNIDLQDFYKKFFTY